LARACSPSSPRRAPNARAGVSRSTTRCSTDCDKRGQTPFVTVASVDSISQAMYAVIASGGKQEKVTEGQQVALELLDGDEGAEVSLTPVLLVDGDDVLASTSALAKASVTGKIVGTTKGPKINGFTYKAKANQRKRYGH